MFIASKIASDIDTLCVAPKHVKREDFFNDMYEMLKARPEVTEITVFYFLNSLFQMHMCHLSRWSFLKFRYAVFNKD